MSGNQKKPHEVQKIKETAVGRMTRSPLYSPLLVTLTLCISPMAWKMNQTPTAAISKSLAGLLKGATLRGI